MKAKEYKFSFNAWMLALFLIQGSVMAGNINAESVGAMYLMQKIDTKKKVITVNGSTIAYNSATIIYDIKGDKTDAAALKQGIAIAFDYDKNKRYFISPMATRIWIKSSHPM